MTPAGMPVTSKSAPPQKLFTMLSVGMKITVAGCVVGTAVRVPWFCGSVKPKVAELAR
jgi:hypothetical protein